MENLFLSNKIEQQSNGMSEQLFVNDKDSCNTKESEATITKRKVLGESIHKEGMAGFCPCLNSINEYSLKTKKNDIINASPSELDTDYCSEQKDRIDDDDKPKKFPIKLTYLEIGCMNQIIWPI